MFKIIYLYSDFCFIICLSLICEFKIYKYVLYMKYNDDEIKIFKWIFLLFVWLVFSYGFFFFWRLNVGFFFVVIVSFNYLFELRFFKFISCFC